jgi:UDP-N-acetylglucosamine 2-epimerase
MNRPLIFTFPNTDMMSSVIIKEMQSFCEAAPNRRLVENLGTANYFSLMRSAAAMAGNSSSGIIEAASFKLPVVDIGPRQQGREHARNVLHAPCETAAIRNSLETACSETFRQSLQNLVNPYGDGHAAERIIQTLQEVPIDKKLLMKKFYELKKDPKHE